MAVTIAVIVAVVVVLLILGLVLILARQRRRRRELQEMYGPEYDRAVEQTGSRRAAERELAARSEQRSQLNIVPLSPSSRAHYSQAWTDVQGRFVDDPQGAVADADDLVTTVMRERGYPTEGFDQQARLLSVDHANTLEHYRNGHEIAGLARRQQATTEQLRQAMMHYRSLFQELVHDDGEQPESGGQQAPQGQYGQQQQMPQPHQQYGQQQQQMPQPQQQYGQPQQMPQGQGQFAPPHQPMQPGQGQAPPPQQDQSGYRG